MCGIFGISYSDNVEASLIKKITSDLFVLSESRGKEASGIGLLHEKVLEVLRIPETASTLITLSQYNKLLSRLNSYDITSHPVIIGNTRLATNGTAYRVSNNQPVTTNTSIGIHNGMVVNEIDLWKKYTSLKREFEVDTEIILKLTDLFISKNNSLEDAIKKVYKEIQGAASIAVMNTDAPNLVLATNTGSVYFLYIPNTIFIFASEKFILEKIVNNYLQDISTNSIHQLTAGQVLSFNYLNFSISQLLLKKKNKQNTKNKHRKFFSLQLLDSQIKSFEHTQNLYVNTIAKLHSHVPDYEKIEHIRRCTKCILPETMPLIVFDPDGVCNFCKTSTKIQYQGEQKLKKVVEDYQQQFNNTDCIVALSGGRDSSFGLHYIKNILKMNPIAYTYDWGMITDIARRNQYRLTAAMGVEHIIVSADIKKKRENIKKNVEAWLRRPNLAMVPLFMAGDKQAEYFAEQVRRQTKRSMMVYCRGNELEDERFKFGYYGIFDGTPGGVIHNLSWMGKVQMAAYYAKEYTLNPSYINGSLKDTLSAFFSAYLMHHEFLYLWHYIPWNEKEIISTLKGKYGWESPTDTIATWRIDDGTPPFYNYIYYKVQGFTEHDGLRSNQIRQGIITRKEAMRLVREENKPRYEALKWYFDVINVDGDRALSIVDRMSSKF